MKKETLKALKKSIQKWTDIVNGEGMDSGTRNCPLCQKFNKGDYPCRDCPVEKFTGFKYCIETPYIEWCNVTNNDLDATIFNERNKVSKKRLKAANAELDFLKSLLPVE